ncbi:orexin receptor type 2-like [Actinia tenebrosa]|uniref:Orexin receptor type 2-like n=1 Tax=Actinia tenebrosa TaxID=6105 RepID=A0A6P8HKG4_ACTTE|nr:orexin receptor type 2-like [Actinia tenebrosa]
MSKMSRGYVWFLLLTSPLNIVGNILVCAIVLKNISMRTFTNYLLVNLAVADLAYGLLQTLGMLVHLSDRDFDWTAFCKSANYAVHVTCGVSIATLTIISIERFFAVVRPFSRNAKKRRRASLILIILWMAILIFMSPTLFLQWSYQKGDYECKTLKIYSPQRRLYYFFIIIIFLFLPSCIIFYCYSRIIYTLWCAPKASSVANAARVKARRKLAQMLVVVSSIFVVSWLTTCVVQLMILFDQSAPQPLETTSLALVHLNTCVNPIIYSLHSADFRRHLKTVCCCCCQSETSEPGNQTIVRSSLSVRQRLAGRISGRVCQGKTSTACEELCIEENPCK